MKNRTSAFDRLSDYIMQGDKYSLFVNSAVLRLIYK